MTSSPPAWQVWLRAIARFVSLQTAIQLVGFLTSVVLIRALAPEFYGYLAVVLAAGMAVQQLADTGTGSALASLGGQAREDRVRFSGLWRGVLEWRTMLALGAVLLVVPCYFPRAAAAIVAQPVLVLLLVLPGLIWVATQSNLDVHQGVLRLAGRTELVQQIDLVSSVLRLGLVLLWGGDLVAAGLIFLGTTIAQTIATRLALRSIVDPRQPMLDEDRRSLRQTFWAQLPYNLLFVTQGQLALLLIAATGAATSLGEFGALSRLAAVFTVFNALQNGLILPAFARLAPDPVLLRRRFREVAIAGFALGAGLWWFTWLFPRPLLWLLGAPYAHLEIELAWLMGAHALLYVGSVLWSLNYARGWVQGAWTVPLASLGAQVAAAQFVQPATTRGAIFLLVFGALPALPLQFWLRNRGLAQLAREPAH